MPDLEGFRHDVRAAANRNAIDALLDLSDDQIAELVVDVVKTLRDVAIEQHRNRGARAFHDFGIAEDTPATPPCPRFVSRPGEFVAGPDSICATCAEPGAAHGITQLGPPTQIAETLTHIED